jgi:hypothetical protein
MMLAAFRCFGRKSSASHLRFSARFPGLRQFWRLAGNSSVTAVWARVNAAAPLEAGAPLKAEAVTAAKTKVLFHPGCNAGRQVAFPLASGGAPDFRYEMQARTA